MAAKIRQRYRPWQNKAAVQVMTEASNRKIFPLESDRSLFSFGKTAVHVKEKKMATKIRKRYRPRPRLEIEKIFPLESDRLNRSLLKKKSEEQNQTYPFSKFLTYSESAYSVDFVMETQKLRISIFLEKTWVK